MLTLRTIANLVELQRWHENKGYSEMEVEIHDLKCLLSAAEWALENGYRPVSQERVSFEEVTKME